MRQDKKRISPHLGSSPSFMAFHRILSVKEPSHVMLTHTNTRKITNINVPSGSNNALVFRPYMTG